MPDFGPYYRPQTQALTGGNLNIPDPYLYSGALPGQTRPTTTGDFYDRYGQPLPHMGVGYGGKALTALTGTQAPTQGTTSQTQALPGAQATQTISQVMPTKGQQSISSRDGGFSGTSLVGPAVGLGVDIALEAILGAVIPGLGLFVSEFLEAGFGWNQPPTPNKFYEQAPGAYQGYQESQAINTKMQAEAKAQGWTPYQLAQSAESQGLVAVPNMAMVGDAMVPTGDVGIWTPQAYWNYANLGNPSGEMIGAGQVDLGGYAVPPGSLTQGWGWQLPPAMGTSDSTIYPTKEALFEAGSFNKRLSGNLNYLKGSPGYTQAYFP